MFLALTIPCYLLQLNSIKNNNKKNGIVFLIPEEFRELGKTICPKNQLSHTCDTVVIGPNIH